MRERVVNAFQEILTIQYQILDIPACCLDFRFRIKLMLLPTMFLCFLRPGDMPK